MTGQARRVVFRQSARDDLGEIFRYIRNQGGSGAVAKAYLRRIRDRCETIRDAPMGGVAREDLGAGIRMAVFERRVVILYRVEADIVWITNIVSGGRDYETLFTDRRPDPEGPA